MKKFLNFRIRNKTKYLTVFPLISLILILSSFYILLSTKEIYLSGVRIEPTAALTINTIYTEEAPVIVGVPIRLIIPKINIDAKIEGTGIDNTNAMVPPKTPESVAWYNLGPKPGEVGNSILAGHFGWKNGIPAAFDDLNLLKPKDKIYIYDEFGNEYVFQVRFLRRFDSGARSEDVFISNDSGHHLNLITCEGVWNKALKSYSKRLVVFADRL